MSRSSAPSGAKAAASHDGLGADRARAFRAPHFRSATASSSRWSARAAPARTRVIAYARDRFAGDAGVEFVRRVITRPERRARARITTRWRMRPSTRPSMPAPSRVSWSAHGLRYGLPASLDETIATGHVAVANVSRGALAAAAGRATPMSSWSRSPLRPEILAAAACRRAAANRAARCWRGWRAAPSSAARLPARSRIDNSGQREEAGERFVAVLRKAIAVRRRCRRRFE